MKDSRLGIRSFLHHLLCCLCDLINSTPSYKVASEFRGLPWWLGKVNKEFACNTGDLGSIPGSGRFPGEENGNPLQYSCPGNPVDRGAWWATDHGVAEELDTT